MPRFLVTYTQYLTLELDQQAIDQVDDEWREHFYPLHTPEEIAGHIAPNLASGARLSQLDGWADLPDDLASVVGDDAEVEVEALEDQPE